ncbi:MAG: chromate transporter [Oscillospiraceae bacterium]|nr:chromate transporter [Oscillospiraceae bacterium]
MLYLRLFFEFFKIGLFAVGGGLATLPFLEEMADKTGWFTRAQLVDMIAVGESTPGPIGVNMATYVGFTTAGVPGAVIATLGLATPCVIVILLIAAFLKNFRENPLVKSAFYGLRPASAGLIASAGLSVLLVALFKNSPALRVDLLSLVSWNWKAVVLMAVLLYLTRYCKKTKKWHPIAFIGISAAAGVLFQFGA